jgi:hypothetical protein
MIGSPFIAQELGVGQGIPPEDWQAVARDELWKANLSYRLEHSNHFNG